MRHLAHFRKAVLSSVIATGVLRSCLICFLRDFGVPSCFSEAWHREEGGVMPCWKGAGQK